MNANQLRASILQMAIEGKLVTQLDSEPAVEQLGNAPEDVPFDIPDKWTFVKLSNISLKIHYGYSASAADKGNCKLLRITDISSGYVNWDNVPFCHVEEKSISKMKLAQNDLVIARSGSVGKAYLIKEINCDAVFASYLIRVIPKFELVYPKYLEIFCNSPFYWKQIQKSSSGSVQLNVNAKSLSNLDIPLPPLEEQKRIVAKLEQLLPLVEEYGKAYETLEDLNAEFPDKLKASVLQSAIKGQLVPQLDSEPAVEQIGKAHEDLPFDIPKKWTFVKLSNISVKVHYGYTASAADNGNYKLLRITDISSGYVNWDTVPFCHVDEKAISKMKLAQNDLVIARSGSVGKAYLIKEINCDAVFASYLIRVIPKFELVYPKYLEIFCNSPFYWKQIQKSSSGSVQLNVNAKSLSNLDIPLPPHEEQKRIVAKVEELFALIDAMKK